MNPEFKPVPPHVQEAIDKAWLILTEHCTGVLMICDIAVDSTAEMPAHRFNCVRTNVDYWGAIGLSRYLNAYFENGMKKIIDSQQL